VGSKFFVGERHGCGIYGFLIGGGLNPAGFDVSAKGNQFVFQKLTRNLEGFFFAVR
jgi:hypothetical protein